MPGTDPAPSKAAFPDQGDTDADIKGTPDGARPIPGSTPSAPPPRFQPPSDPSTSNPDTSSPSSVASGSEGQGGKGQGGQNATEVPMDNPMALGERVRDLHRAIDRFIEGVQEDSVPVNNGGEPGGGPQKVVQKLKAWKEESATWEGGKSKL